MGTVKSTGLKRTILIIYLLMFVVLFSPDLFSEDKPVRLKGVAISAYWNSDFNNEYMYHEIDYLQSLGFNSIEVVVTWYQDGRDSDKISEDPKQTLRDEDVKRLINYIKHEKNMHVNLKPHVEPFRQYIGKISEEEFNNDTKPYLTDKEKKYFKKSYKKVKSDIDSPHYEAIMTENVCRNDLYTFIKETGVFTKDGDKNYDTLTVSDYEKIISYFSEKKDKEGKDNDELTSKEKKNLIKINYSLTKCDFPCKNTACYRLDNTNIGNLKECKKILEQNGFSTWRAKLNPKDEDMWFSSYELFLKHYLKIAVLYDVDLFTVGTELVSMGVPKFIFDQNGNKQKIPQVKLIDNNKKWYKLISELRKFEKEQRATDEYKKLYHDGVKREIKYTYAGHENEIFECKAFETGNQYEKENSRKIFIPDITLTSKKNEDIIIDYTEIENNKKVKKEVKIFAKDYEKYKKNVGIFWGLFDYISMTVYYGLGQIPVYDITDKITGKYKEKYIYVRDYFKNLIQHNKESDIYVILQNVENGLKKFVNYKTKFEVLNLKSDRSFCDKINKALMKDKEKAEEPETVMTEFEQYIFPADIDACPKLCDEAWDKKIKDLNKWKNALDRYIEISNTVGNTKKELRVIFGEIGYRSVDYGQYKPFQPDTPIFIINVGDEKKTKIIRTSNNYNPMNQKICYDAFFEAVKNILWLEGYYIWEEQAKIPPLYTYIPGGINSDDKDIKQLLSGYSIISKDATSVFIDKFQSQPKNIFKFEDYTQSITGYWYYYNDGKDRGASEFKFDKSKYVDNSKPHIQKNEIPDFYFTVSRENVKEPMKHRSILEGKLKRGDNSIITHLGMGVVFTDEKFEKVKSKIANNKNTIGITFKVKGDGRLYRCKFDTSEEIETGKSVSREKKSCKNKTRNLYGKYFYADKEAKEVTVLFDDLEQAPGWKTSEKFKKENITGISFQTAENPGVLFNKEKEVKLEIWDLKIKGK